MHDIGDDGAEDRHVEEHGAYGDVSKNPIAVLDDEGDDVAEYGPDDQRDMGGFSGRMGDGHPFWEVSGTAEAEDIAAVGVNNGVEAGDEAGDCDEGQERSAHALAEDGLESEKQGLVGDAYLGRSGGDARVEKEGQHRGDDQGEDAVEEAFGHVALWIVRFLGGEGQLLDGQVEPNGEG